MSDEFFILTPNVFWASMLIRTMPVGRFCLIWCAWLLISTTSHAQYIPKRQWQRYPTLILGTWQSLEDPRSVLLITRTTYQEKYPGLPNSKLTYRITNACPNPDAPKLIGKQKDILVTYDAKESLSYCYGIDLLNNNLLTLIYLGRGNSLHFKRIK